MIILGLGGCFFFFFLLQQVKVKDSDKTFTFTGATLVKPNLYIKTEMTPLEQNDLGFKGFLNATSLKNTTSGGLLQQGEGLKTVMIFYCGTPFFCPFLFFHPLELEPTSREASIVLRLCSNPLMDIFNTTPLNSHSSFCLLKKTKKT